MPHMGRRAVSATLQAPNQAAMTLLGVRKTPPAVVTVHCSAGKSTLKSVTFTPKTDRRIATVCSSCHMAACKLCDIMTVMWF